MPSTYSPNLRIELIANGEQANTWGITTNNNLGTLIGEAIAGLVDIDVSASDVTLTALDGVTDQARQMMITLSGTPGVARSVFCPDGDTKVYVVANDADDVVTFSTVSGTGVDIPVGTSKFLYCDGVDVYEAVTAVDTLLLGGAPTTSLEAANKGYVDSSIATLNTFTASRAIVSNGSGNLTAAATTSTEVGYLSGVTSAIQTQLNGKQAAGSYAPATSGTSILKGNGSGGFSNASAGTDYAPATSGTSILKGNGSGGFSNASAGTDYAPATSGTAILKGNGSGGFSSASAGTDYAPATSGSSILSGNGSGGFSNVTVGTGLSFSGGTLSSTVTGPIPSGTKMLFVQAFVPSGWTIDSTHNNKALRIVNTSGGGTGGSVGFTSAFASQTPSGSVSVSGGAVGAHTLSVSEIPSHTHPVLHISAIGVNGASGGTLGTVASLDNNTGAAGGGGSHTHPFTNPTATFSGSAINLAVQYVDAIICTKD